MFDFQEQKQTSPDQLQAIFLRALYCTKIWSEPKFATRSSAYFKREECGLEVESDLLGWRESGSG